MTIPETRSAITNKAAELGFMLTGFAPAGLLTDEAGRLREWLTRGYHAGMGYMERNFEKREDVRLFLSGAKSVVVFAFNYNSGGKFTNAPGTGKISRYAWGLDYHDVLTGKLYELMEFCSGIIPGFSAKPFADAAPVMDKAWAVRAGIGWMGKNTNIINPGFGSYFFIAGLVTNTPLGTAELITDHCGTCTACLDACPTGAFTAPYLLDAGKCISYLTIENKGTIPEQLAGTFTGWFFGCDICQEVCPWNNRFSVANPGSSLYTRGITPEVVLNEVLVAGDAELKVRFAATPLSRPKPAGLKRNAAFLQLETEKE